MVCFEFKNKTYGICTITGHLISRERLKIVPHATKTIAGKHIDIRKTNARRTVIKKNSTPKVKSKIISKPVKKDASAHPTPPKDDEDLILEIEELPDEMLSKNHEDFNDTI